MFLGQKYEKKNMHSTGQLKHELVRDMHKHHVYTGPIHGIVLTGVTPKC